MGFGNERALVFLCVCVVLCSCASAYIDCVYDETPVFWPGNEMFWYCETDHDYCMSYVSYADEIYQVNPERRVTEHFGVIDKFEVNNRIVRPSFGMLNLRPNQTVTFGVFCSNESFERQVRPLFLEPDKLFEFSEFLQRNWPYFIAIFFVLIVAALATYYLLRVIR